MVPPQPSLKMPHEPEGSAAHVIGVQHVPEQTASGEQQLVLKPHNCPGPAHVHWHVPSVLSAQREEPAQLSL